ncbi:GntR family transcriptional regulator, partial [Kocuria oceani]
MLPAPSGRGPAYRELADHLRLLVLDGRVPLGVALPGERELAAALDLSRTTVTG